MQARGRSGTIRRWTRDRTAARSQPPRRWAAWPSFGSVRSALHSRRTTDLACDLHLACQEGISSCSSIGKHRLDGEVANGIDQRPFNGVDRVRSPVVSRPVSGTYVELLREVATGPLEGDKPRQHEVEVSGAQCADYLGEALLVRVVLKEAAWATSAVVRNGLEDEVGEPHACLMFSTTQQRNGICHEISWIGSPAEAARQPRLDERLQLGPVLGGDLGTDLEGSSTNPAVVATSECQEDVNHLLRSPGSNVRRNSASGQYTSRTYPSSVITGSGGFLKAPASASGFTRSGFSMPSKNARRS